MTTYTFQEVAVYGEKSGKCPKCGKHYKRREKFWSTINPWNKNKDGIMKTYDEVYDDVVKKQKKWLAEPIEPHNCKEKLPPEESNPLTIDEINELVSFYREKESQLIKLSAQIKEIENEIKEKSSMLIGKTFEYMEYKHKGCDYFYEPRESKITELYKYGNYHDGSIIRVYHKGRNKTDQQFNYDYKTDYGATIDLDGILKTQMRYYIEKLELFDKCWNPEVDIFNKLFDKENKTDDEIMALSIAIAYLKLNEALYRGSENRYNEEKKCLLRLGEK